MKKDFEDDDLEELDDDDSDSDDFDDYDDDDVPVAADSISPPVEEGWEELDEEDDVPVAAETVSPPAEEDLEELEEELESACEFETEERRAAALKTEEDDDASFFDEAADEGDDLGLEFSVGEAAQVAPPASTADVITQETAKPAAKGFQSVFLALPAVGILLGVGYYFLKGGENIPMSPPPAVKKEMLREEIIPGYERKVPFVKPKADNTVPADYIELKKVELADRSKIDSLANAGLLKKKRDASTSSIEKLVLTLYKTTIRYVVSQTYHYTDGTKWTVETQFSEYESEQEEVIKAFDSVYAG